MLKMMKQRSTLIVSNKCLALDGTTCVKRGDIILIKTIAQICFVSLYLRSFTNTTTAYLTKNHNHFQHRFNARSSLYGMDKALSAQLYILVLSGTLKNKDISPMINKKLQTESEGSLVNHYTRQYLLGSNRNTLLSRACILHTIANDEDRPEFFCNINSEYIDRITTQRCNVGNCS
jgi:hypothetical protein